MTDATPTLCAAGCRPATPALTQILEIRTDHTCDSGAQPSPVDPRSPQSLMLPSTINANTRRSHTLSPAIAIEPAAAGYSSFRDFVHCRFTDAGRRCVWLRSI